ncbi:unnamed protein product [Ceutorhynchus assimilis]|uniref:MADF domain-containing protein n=1 Tax=Ceutorhynchus assimilis TaxID=467358 RepID=A0A9N9MNS5_9CUCU|nr:unnamed protein product [Ceutorhynchus assimilis]
MGRTTGDELKKKWKNLRDSYSKFLRTEKTKTGQETKILDRYKTWPWARQMEFLKVFLQYAKTNSNISVKLSEPVEITEQTEQKDQEKENQSPQNLVEEIQQPVDSCEKPTYIPDQKKKRHLK